MFAFKIYVGNLLHSDVMTSTVFIVLAKSEIKREYYVCSMLLRNESIHLAISEIMICNVGTDNS
jgi:hypothetical protein